ncbi:Protein UXT-like protein [Trichoplax sp. H2]|nr:Protein UXT-like protein [Trichoplax sp. H2]|eukprot:RDD36799.1 Protein UXT-like protein [Trichoplax sp. H2]
MVLWVEGRGGAIHIVQFPFPAIENLQRQSDSIPTSSCVCIRTVNKGSPPCLSMDKLTKFEQFINEKLKGDLALVNERRESVCQQIANYLKLRQSIENLQLLGEDGKTLRSKVDLGCNFYVQANVNDTSKIFVSVGFGFYLELTLDEAIKFMGKKIAHLTEINQKLTVEASKIKANIKIVLEKLAQLQILNDDKPSQNIHW